MTAARTPYKGGSPTVFALFNESTRRGWTQKVIADKAGVARNTVASWWAGDREPGVANVERWARALGGFIVFSMPYELPARTVKPRSEIERWGAEEKAKIGYAGRDR